MLDTLARTYNEAIFDSDRDRALKTIEEALATSLLAVQTFFEKKSVAHSVSACRITKSSQVPSLRLGRIEAVLLQDIDDGRAADAVDA